VGWVKETPRDGRLRVGEERRGPSSAAGRAFVNEQGKRCAAGSGRVGTATAARPGPGLLAVR
jgi:hypothetical protein